MYSAIICAPSPKEQHGCSVWAVFDFFFTNTILFDRNLNTHMRTHMTTYTTSLPLPPCCLVTIKYINGTGSWPAPFVWINHCQVAWGGFWQHSHPTLAFMTGNADDQLPPLLAASPSLSRTSGSTTGGRCGMALEPPPLPPQKAAIRSGKGHDHVPSHPTNGSHDPDDLNNNPQHQQSQGARQVST